MKLISDSRATDAAIRALADAACAARELETWRIVGGHMVNLHALWAGVDLPPRATRDADLAVDLLAVRDGGLLRRLGELGYRNTASSNRFVLDTPGVPATIDILAPSYSTRHEPNVDAGPIAVDGIPALHIALARPPVVLDLAAVLTDGTRVSAVVHLPDVLSAIAIKTFAYAERFAARDAEDLYRLVEVAHRAGITADAWPDQPTFVAAGRRLRTFFDSPGSALATATASKQGQVRFRALVRLLLERPAQQL
jgi:hypothetical protein